MSCEYCKNPIKYGLRNAQPVRLLINTSVWRREDDKNRPSVMGHRALHAIACQSDWFLACQQEAIER